VISAVIIAITVEDEAAMLNIRTEGPIQLYYIGIEEDGECAMRTAPTSVPPAIPQWGKISRVPAYLTSPFAAIGRPRLRGGAGAKYRVTRGGREGGRVGF
jgi:hypothetical protein